jgi:hypothetical protein
MEADSELERQPRSCGHVARVRLVLAQLRERALVRLAHRADVRDALLRPVARGPEVTGGLVDELLDVVYIGT